MSNTRKVNTKDMNSKPHLQLLDALRGVAALIVLWYHCYECFGYEVAKGSGIYTQTCDHGYLAVDFFFLLSGFVIGYAYDGRWKGGMSIWTFFKRRLVRLHPMVIVGAVIGLVCFLIGGGNDWSGNPASAGNIVLVFVMTMLMIPVYPGWGADVRGNTEMYPLNGPCWSLFFEYIGNILYALLLRRLPMWALSIVVVLSGGTLGYLVLDSGYLGYGWSFADYGFWTGLLRMLFPYALGMLMARLFMKNDFANSQSNKQARATFVVSTLVLLILLPMPFIGNPAQPWQNGLYIMALLCVVFPLIVWYAAKAGTDKNRLCSFLGELSYPLYVVHYPLMYLFYKYHGFPNVTCTMADVWPMAVATFVGSIVLATVLLYVYDKPVRKKLLNK